MKNLLLSFSLLLSGFVLAQEGQESIVYNTIQTDTIYFKSGEFQLDAIDHIALDAFLIDFKEVSFDKKIVEIEAHTDADGSVESNKILSQKRSQSVVDYMASIGFSTDDYYVKAFGESTPVADNQSAGGKAKNRRVVVRLKLGHYLSYLEGNVFEGNKQLSELKVVVMNKHFKDSTLTNHEGYFKVSAPKDEVVSIAFFNEGKLLKNEMLHTGRTKKKDYRLSLPKTVMKPLKLDEGYKSIKGTIINGGIPIENATVVVKNNSFSDTTQTDKEGYYTINVPENSVIAVEVFKKGYFYKKKMVNTSRLKEDNVSLKITKAEIGEMMILKDLNFHGNQAVLLERSLLELPSILKFVQINDSLTFEIQGHVNQPNQPTLPETSWDFKLSVNRAKSIYDYLVRNGIDGNRLVYKGYGNSQMLYPYATSEIHQSANRRVEIKITGKIEKK